MNEPLVSIIIPCYNHGSYLETAVNSVLHQTYPAFEIIVVDDGSTDKNTLRLLENFNKPNTRVFRILRQGVSNARNFAIQQSIGKYILPLDADDKLEKNYISDAVSVLESNPEVKVVTCLTKFFGYMNGIFHLPDYSIETLICRNTIVITSLFRRSDFEKTKGFNPEMKLGFEDWDFWLSILEDGGKVYKLNKIGFYYRIKPGSRNSNLSLETLKLLRHQIYSNHKELYARNFFDPFKSFEYDIISNSLEFRTGSLLLKPYRFLYRNLYFILSKLH